MTRKSHAASAEASGSGRSLALPSSGWMVGIWVIRSRIEADGSVARMFRPNHSLNATAKLTGAGAGIYQRHPGRRAQVTSYRLPPLGQPFMRDFADSLVCR